MTSRRGRSRLLWMSKFAVFVALFASPAFAQTSLGIPGVLAPGVAPELVQGGFAALEGPVSAADGTVYFSDRMPDRTYRLGLDGRITVYQENTGAIVDAKGGIYFTDPGPRPIVPGRPAHVYYLPVPS
jgi:hypothetical protein